MASPGSSQPSSQHHVFGTTRGKVLVLLCGSRQTVAELAAELDVTQNAVRAQLQRLERDGLVRQAGSRQGVRRPHVEFEVTPDAIKLFPRAYEPLLKNVVDVLTDQLPTSTRRRILRQAGIRMLRSHF